MPKRILVTGLGSKLAWKIRAEQLGHAMGAVVMPHAPRKEMEKADVVVVCKWTSDIIIADLRKTARPWAWDIVDAYPQPESYKWEPALARQWLRNTLFDLNPKALIAATGAMLEDAAYRGFVLPHHARPKQAVNSLRPRVKAVGYEGMAKYLGSGPRSWRGLVEAECAARGWQFIVNPERLADVDILVAMRDNANYVCSKWKSHVKLANAHATGTPIVCAREAGYMENASGAERWATSADELTQAFDALTPVENRRAVHELFLERAKQYTLDAVAQRYRSYLETL